MSLSFYQQFAEWLKGGPVALAIVVAGSGSVPRETGAKMLIRADGSIASTIGGGAGEAKVIAAAQAVLSSGQKQAVTIDLSGTPQRSVEGICGGWMRVWIECWQPEQRFLVETIIGDLSCRQNYLVIPFGQEDPYLTQLPPATASVPNAYVEAIQPLPLLLIVGGGHVGCSLAAMASWIGFTVAVQDERSEFANGERFPQAAHIWNGPVAALLPQLSPLPELYIALVTRGFTYDLSALKAIWSAQIPYRYLGMIGSRKRVKTVLQSLATKGYSDQQMQSLYAPIGLPIHALTPEEIAVSICAQLIQIRRSPIDQWSQKSHHA